MSAPFPVDIDAVDRYVDQLPPRTRGSANVYRCVLGQFVRFVAQHPLDGGISTELLQSWLRRRADSPPIHSVLERTSLLDHFLDWLVVQGLIASNPFAQLRQEIGKRPARVIGRALVAADAETAIEALRPIPRFASHLGAVMREHVDLMRALGLRYQTQERELLRFDRFLQHRNDLVDAPLKTIVDEWAKDGKSALDTLRCTETGRIVARALARRDPAVVIPSVDRRLRQQAEKEQRRPRILTEDEVHQLLAAARSFPSPKLPLRPQSLHTMLVLAYCAGLRLGELVRLTVGDIDLADRLVEIRETKFFKTRRLPVTPAVVTVLENYLSARRNSGAPTEASAALFWSEKTRGGYEYKTVNSHLVNVIRQAGLKPASGRVGTRIHDLRHTFAVHRLTAWYRDGIDPQSRLPYLATYLGHKSIESTLVYLTITDELLQKAGDRFRAFGAKSLHPVPGGSICQ